MRAFVLVVAGLLGAAIGSFLNVVVHRVPRGESVVKPASRCPRCGTQIAARDNIPVVSWIVLRGRCRACRVPIPGRYPMIEVASSVLWVAAFVRFNSYEVASLVACTATVLLALSAIDLEHRRLPNVIVLPATAAAVMWVAVVSLAKGERWTVIHAFAAGASAFAVLLAIALVSGGMGFGDVKLAGFIGVVTGRFGWEVTFVAVFGAFILGGLVAVALLVTKRRGRKDAIPFGPSLAAAAMIAIYGGPELASGWFELF